MNAGDQRPHRPWSAKFADAFRGVAAGTRGQSSFAVHFVVAAGVIAAAAWLHVERNEWCLLVLSITAVLVAEMFNSSLEYLGRAVDDGPNQQLGRALDVASAAVLVAAAGASCVGATIFLPYFVALLGFE